MTGVLAVAVFVMKKILAILFSVILYSTFCFSQKVDTTLFINIVEIKTNRIEAFSKGNNQTKIDSSDLQTMKSDNLSDVLSQLSGIYIKSYGPGSLATPAFRGSGAVHTAVLWNGFNLQGPTLGQIDLTTIPVGFLDEVTIQHGGSSALSGSGTIGGAVHLNNIPEFDKGLSASFYGSYGNYNSINYGLKTTISKKKYSGTIRLLNQTADNNFPFVNTTKLNKPEEEVRNAYYFQRGILQENFIKLSDAQHFSFRVWLQESERGIPPTMLMQMSESSLNGSFARLTADWKRIGKNSITTIRSGYFNEVSDYQDELSKIESNIRFRTSISEIENKLFLPKNQEVNFGINNTFNFANSNGFQANKTQNRISGFGSYKLSGNSDKWHLVFNIREEIVEGKVLPLIPSLGFDKFIFKNLLIKGNITRTYRIPTFNDLYWYPGGNENLNPEIGWTEEIGISREKKYDYLNLNLGTTFFNNNIKDWIIWLPKGGYWAPQNLQYVWARGLENSAEIKFSVNKITLNARISYQYVKSTNIESKMENDASLDKQLIFVPEHASQASIKVSYNKTILSFFHTYTGIRYTSSDNKEYQPFYFISNLCINQNIKIHKHYADLTLRINNLFNTVYQSLPWRPMPLRNYQIGISIKLNQ